MEQITSEKLKQIVAGLPRGYSIDVNGLPCVEVSISVGENGDLAVNFKSDNDTPKWGVKLL